MRAFAAGLLVAVVVALGTGILMSYLSLPADAIYATEHAQLH